LITFFGAASNPADTGLNNSPITDITPPSNMTFGQLVYVFCQNRTDTGTITILETGGQTWNYLTQQDSTSAQNTRIFWCRFNGNWTADPSFLFTNASNVNTAVMLVYTPSNTGKLWGVAVSEVHDSFEGPTTPFTIPIQSVEPTVSSTVTIAAWAVQNDFTFSSLTGGWTTPGSAQYRNIAGADQAVTFAHKIQTSANGTGVVSKNESGTAAGITSIITFYEYSVPGLPFISDCNPVQFWDADCDTYNESENYGVHEKCFCQPWNCTDLINTQFIAIGGDDEFSMDVIDEDGNVLYTAPFTRETLNDGNDEEFRSVFRLWFRPSDEGICDEKIAMKIYNDASSPRELVYKSDCLDVKTFHTGTKLIEYYNNRDVAGLIYADISPDEVFYLRVPCRFFHERKPKTQNAMELTSEVLITSATSKKQKLLEVEHAPYYMHNKIADILTHHQYITIDNDFWKLEEDYEVNQGEKRWPLKTATCYLTKKTSVIRSVI
jgi:hypothetical protein